MVQPTRPRIVVTIHGIQTTGKWQKGITPHLARHGLIPYHIDYGWFDVLRFLLPFTRAAKVQAIRDELRQLIAETGVRRVSIVAHSFGTLLAMEALRRDQGELRFDRVVLTGSIVPLDFDWAAMLDRDKWVMAVRNERAAQDWVVSLAAFVSHWLKWVFWLNAGPSGRVAFGYGSPHLIDACLEGGHSQVHNVAKFNRWARFLAYPMMPADILGRLQRELQFFRQEAAKLLGANSAHIRTNFFAPLDGFLRIVPGASDNMTYAPEFEVRISPDHGGTGTAFKQGQPFIVIRTGATWSGNTLPGEELDKIHPDLKWVISLPIKSEKRKAIVGVVNVDGLHAVPPMISDPLSRGCQDAMVALWLVIEERVGPMLEAAFLGDQLPELEI